MPCGDVRAASAAGVDAQRRQRSASLTRRVGRMTSAPRRRAAADWLALRRWRRCNPRDRSPQPRRSQQALRCGARPRPQSGEGLTSVAPEHAAPRTRHKPCAAAAPRLLRPHHHANRARLCRPARTQRRAAAWRAAVGVDDPGLAEAVVPSHIARPPPRAGRPDGTQRRSAARRRKAAAASARACPAATSDASNATVLGAPTAWPRSARAWERGSV